MKLRPGASMLLAMMPFAMAQPSLDGPLRLRGRIPRREPQPTGERFPLEVRCDQCGAGAGADCNPRTLGAHKYHLRRVQRARDQAHEK